MKKIVVFLCFFALIQGISAQNKQGSNDTIKANSPPQYHQSLMEIDYSALYFDANLGYLPLKENASWAAQISGGYCFNEQSAVGIGVGVFGREHIFKRYGLGAGFQYRHNYPQRLLVIAEFGYLFQHKMHDGSLNKDMIYVSQHSKPIYFQLEAQWRLWRSLTLGIAATQSGDLYFRRYINEVNTTQELWRINALTIQLGFAFDKNSLSSN